ncbi:MarR family winged helix-turn-helix transcriptional regulator [Flavobacterium sp. LB2P44]|uniref:MarR family winged helix-turn-helix transcriptional regulator n=1 Tax=Flavobacterium sp. LB2P44 TaxID=3401713 RepID=UPI003AAE2259
MENDETRESLKLENQLCFPLYAASRLVTKCYHPILDNLGITYPQYLVLIVLWESDTVNVNYLSDKLKLQSNTLTPLLKRMQEMDLVSRVRSKIDERNVIISLTETGNLIQLKASILQKHLSDNVGLTSQEGIDLHRLLNKLIQNIKT